jgi:hypothetical protein
MVRVSSHSASTKHKGIRLPFPDHRSVCEESRPEGTRNSGAAATSAPNVSWDNALLIEVLKAVTSPNYHSIVRQLRAACGESNTQVRELVLED